MIEVSGQGEDGLASGGRAELRMDGGRPERYWLSLSGVSGPLLAPDARTLPAGTGQIGSSILAHLASPAAGLASTIPLSLGLRFGVSEHAELSLGFLGVLRPSSLEELSTSWATGTLTWKRTLREGP